MKSTAHSHTVSTAALLLVLLGIIARFGAVPVRAGGGSSPVPYIDILSPLRVAPGASSFTLTIHGANFTANSVAHWGSTALATTYVNRGKLTATVPASLLTNVGTGWITVVNPTPGGGKSNTFYVQVTNAAGNFNPSVFTYAPVTMNSFYIYGQTQGDLRGTGILDLIAIDYYGYLWVFLGNGDGTFQPGVSYSDFYGAYGAATGDVDGDGKLDIVVAEASTTNAFSVHLGNGDGTFQSGTLFGPETTAYLVQLADMNGDGHLDVVAAATNGNIYYLQGNGDGTFEAAVSVAQPENAPTNVTIGDFDGDGILDIAYGDSVSGNMVLLRGVGDGTFQAPETFTAQSPASIAAQGDFNEDGWLDLIGGASGPSSSLLLNDTSGGFLASTAVNVGSSLQIVQAWDLNGDGHLDAISSGGNGLTVSLGKGDGTFDAPVSYDTSAYLSESLLVGNYVAGGGLGVSSTDYDTGALVVLLPTVSISPSPLDFGTVAIHSTAGPETLTITNNTPTTVTLSGAALSGTNASDFAIAGTTCGATLGPAASCTSTISFTPSAAGALTATFTLTDSAAGGSQTAQLTGSGAVAPGTLLNPTSLSFPVELLSSTSSSRSVTLQNNGDATLNISSIALGGADPGDYNEDSTCGATLAIGDTCSISVSFAPTTTGSRPANVTITDDALTSPQTIPLSGTGVNDTVQLSAASLTFAPQVDSTTSASQVVTLTNIGSGSLTISSITIAGADSADFAQTNNCGSTVASQASCTINVTFTPAAAGSLTGTLTINDSSPKTPHTVGLTGTGEDFTFAVSTAQTVQQGASAIFQLTVTPEDNFAQLISFSCTNSIKGSTCAVSPTSVTPAGANPSTVNLTITTTGPTSTAILPAFYRGNPWIFLPGFLGMALSLLALWSRGRHPAVRTRSAAWVLLACATIFACLCAAGCGESSGSRYTPPGSYTVTVTATSGSLSHSVSAQITVQ